MALVFKTLKWKNFLSTGDSFTEIDFQDKRTTLIVGHNGAGKSTMLDALSFALFGKAHRNINKGLLVNSINGKGTVIEVELDAHGSQYKIVRGIKPNLFEIWRDGVMINQDSHAKEYQKILEQNILKLNHKSFHQIVVLGSSSFIPFMQLSANARREVIEDLLDIGVFSKMNMLMREKNSALREMSKQNTHELDMINTKIDAQRKYIRDITAINDDQRSNYERAIDKFQKEIDSIQEENIKLSSDIESLSDGLTNNMNISSEKKQKLLQFKAQFSQQSNSIVKDAKFYEDNTSCPTCTQSIDDDLRQTKVEQAKAKARELQSALTRIDDEMSAIDEVLNELHSTSEEVRNHTSTLTSNNNSIKHLHSQITSTQKALVELDSKGGNLEQANSDMASYNEKKNELNEKKVYISDKVSYNSVISEMLKDTGIKTKIIKQYVPIINKLVNQYLQVLDFFVHFELDENFSETIKSRHRDSFTYDSFSEGEKQRIDLALLFTWRAVAKMKNSVATNLLILDETFDSSLDYDGVDNLMKILYTLDDDTNVFVISHKGEVLDGKFDRKIEFKKIKNFSKIHLT
jgi:DNA repair exonuclease SbcCD ATPase subunit